MRKFYNTLAKNTLQLLLLAMLFSQSIGNVQAQSIEVRDCTCNSEYTVNSTFNTVIVISGIPSILPAIDLTVVGSSGLLNATGGPLGNPTFSRCEAAGGCMVAGQTIAQYDYYLEVRGEPANLFSLAVDGPDAGQDPEENISFGPTTCPSINGTTRLTIPLDAMNANCLMNDVDLTVASNGGTYSTNNNRITPQLPTGFTQSGTGALTIDFDDYNQNDNPYTLYLSTDQDGCNLNTVGEYRIFREPNPDIEDTHLACVRAGSQIFLTQMFGPDNTTNNGTFDVTGLTPDDEGRYTVPAEGGCFMVRYTSVDTNCVNSFDEAMLLISIAPDKPAFTIESTENSPACMNGGSISATLNRTSTGTNPMYTVTSSNDLLTATLSGNNLTMPAPSSRGSVRYTVCLTERGATPVDCSPIMNDTICQAEFCRSFTVFNDGYECGANALFSSNCPTAYKPDLCPIDVKPGLALECSFFMISTPDIMTAEINLDEPVVDCTADSICGDYNISFFGINANPGGGGTIGDFPGVGQLCSIFNFSVLGFRPLGALADLLGCDKTIAQFILDLVSKFAGGDGGNAIVIADTDGDGAFDNEVYNGSFPAEGDFCVPNNIKGSGYVQIRALAGWPNSVTGICGNVQAGELSLLGLLPIGSIPIVGPIVEAVLERAGCDILLEFSQATDVDAYVNNSNPPVFTNCDDRQRNYITFAQNVSCRQPIDWSIPNAVSACDNTPLIYRGVVESLDDIDSLGIYQTDGPALGDSIPAGDYNVTYTAVSCNGNPSQCTFRIVVEEVNPVWTGGALCCDTSYVWLGGSGWDGTGMPPVPMDMLSLTAIGGSYPEDTYGEWTGEGVNFVDPDGQSFTGDEYFYFDPGGLDGNYTLTYSIKGEPCDVIYSQSIDVTCQDLNVALSDITTCPAQLVPERVVLLSLNDDNLVVSTTGFDVLAMDGAHYGGGASDLVEDLVDVPVVDGRVVIPAFYAPAERAKDYQICVSTDQTNDTGCGDSFCYTVTVTDTIPPVFDNCPKEPIIVDAPSGWCASYVNFDFPEIIDNCQGEAISVQQVDQTGLSSGSLFPVGLTVLSYMAIDTVGNQSYCELQIIVNDSREAPSITCPSNQEVPNDQDICGAVVDNIAPTEVTDFCEDHIAVTYEVTDENDDIIACGFEDASGLTYPVGTNTVKYKVQDQPLVLITEIIQDGTISGMEITNFGPAQVDITNAKFILKDENGNALETFTLPANNNISNKYDRPIFPTIFPIQWNIYNHDNILDVGETFKHVFNGDEDGDGDQDVSLAYDRCDVRTYCLGFLDRVIDEATINDEVKGNVILRKSVCDHDAQSDFIPETPCDQGNFVKMDCVYEQDDYFMPPRDVRYDCTDTLIGRLPTMTPNGEVMGLQLVAPNKDSCDFTVTVNDTEAPTCIWHDTIPSMIRIQPLALAMPIQANTCLKDVVTMPDGIVDDVNIYNLAMTVANSGAVVAYLRAPSGTRIKLFEDLCATDTDNCDGDGIDGGTDILVHLDETNKWIPRPSITNALCNPSLAPDMTYRPLESFKAFYGQQGGGDWTLEVYAKDGVTGSLTDWDLQILYQIPFGQGDTTLANIPMQCDSVYSWIHPILEDNCCSGEVSLTYQFDNDVTDVHTTETVELKNLSGTVNMQGCRITRTFPVGVTEITYTLTDQYNNKQECGFTITVEDTELPEYVDPFCPNRTINLPPGACTGILTDPPMAMDNCGDIDTITYCFEATREPADITILPIGNYNLVAKAKDQYGNIRECVFEVNVVEFMPASSSLSCAGRLNLSLGRGCLATIRPEDILIGNQYRCYDNYCIEVTTLTNEPHSTTFTQEDEGKTFNVTVIDCNGEEPFNSCTSQITIEEKLFPVFECPNDTMISCNIDVEARKPVYDTTYIGSVISKIDTSYVLITGEPDLESCEPNAKITYADDWIRYDDCDDPRAQVDRTWTIIDDEGNKVECTQTITIQSLDLANVDFPENLEMTKSLACIDVRNDPSLIHPDSTGYPMINDIIVNHAGGLCMVSLHYSDEIYDICEGSYEILRYWKVRNMCLPVSPTNPIQHVQVIKVLDDSAPYVKNCPDDIEVAANPWDCRYNGTIPVPSQVKEGCANGFDFKASIFGGGRISHRNDNGELTVSVSDLAVNNTYTIKYFFKDKCYNKSECSYTITVKDRSAPIVSTKEFVVVGLVPDGRNGGASAKVFAENIDNGSFDKCSGVKEMLIRRATFNNCLDDLDGNGVADNEEWGDFVKFCCEDFTSERESFPVEIKVTDYNGYESLGWSNVKVEDNTPPRINVPRDTFIYCDSGLFITELSQYSSEASIDIKQIDESLWQYVGDHDFGRLDSASHYSLSCSKDSISFVDVLVAENGDGVDECGIGKFTRIWRAKRTTITKGTFYDHGFQHITTRQRYTPLAVKFAEDTTIIQGVTCNGPSKADLAEIQPRFVDYGMCDVIGISTKLDTFLFEQGVCKKWLVEYRFANWCQNSQYTSEDIALLDRSYYATFMYQDSLAPTILTCKDTTYSYTESCKDGYVLTLSSVAQDNGGCIEGGWLKWQAYIDLWGDGTVDAIVSDFNYDNDWNRITGGSINNLPKGFTYSQEVYVKRGSPTTSYELKTIQLDHPSLMLVGSGSEHKVTWKVTDGCHNEASCNQLVTIKDTKAPTSYCLSLSTAVMKQGEKNVELWAFDFNRGSEDNCTESNRLIFTFDNVSPVLDQLSSIHYFDADGLSTEAQYLKGEAQKWVPNSRSSARVFDCDDVENSPLTVIVTTWDESMNHDFCEVELKLINNGSNCGDDSNRYVINGSVKTTDGAGMQGVTVQINALLNEYPKTTLTDHTGKYSFEDIVGSVNYNLSATYEDDILGNRAVNTLDIAVIQRHILELNKLDNPYLLTAADINNDGKVQARDLLPLRRAILGLNKKFPNNTSWKFLKANQQMSTGRNPYPYVEDIGLINFNSNMEGQDFVAIKVGDVTGDINKISEDDIYTRSDKTFRLSILDRSVVVGEDVTVAFTSADVKQLYGCQFDLDLKGLQYQNVKPGAIDINETHVASNNHFLKISYSKATPISLSKEDILFTLHFKAKDNGTLGEMLSRGNRLSPQAYVGTDLNTVRLDVDVRDGIGYAEYQLLQNEPNPFKQTTTIGFVLPSEANATLTIMDLTGKVISTKDIKGKAGFNEVTVSNLGVSGVLYYQLQSGDFEATKRMIIIE